MEVGSIKLRFNAPVEDLNARLLFRGVCCTAQIQYFISLVVLAPLLYRSYGNLGVVL